MKKRHVVNIYELLGSVGKIKMINYKEKQEFKDLFKFIKLWKRLIKVFMYVWNI